MMRIDTRRLRGRGTTKANFRAPGRGGIRGSSLVEAMVTVVLLSVSLLGLAMLQGNGLKFSTASYVRTQANLLAYDIIDKMRVDPSSADQYTADDPGGTCSATTVSVDNDLTCWHQSLASTLAQGSGSITQNGNLFTVVVNWSDQSIRMENGDEKQVSFTVEL